MKRDVTQAEMITVTYHSFDAHNDVTQYHC